MRRPQFTLKMLLWLMVVVAAFCAGRASEIRYKDRELLQLEDKIKFAEKRNARYEKAYTKWAKEATDEIELLRGELSKSRGVPRLSGTQE